MIHYQIRDKDNQPSTTMHSDKRMLLLVRFNGNTIIITNDISNTDFNTKVKKKGS